MNLRGLSMNRLNTPVAAGLFGLVVFFYYLSSTLGVLTQISNQLGGLVKLIDPESGNDLYARSRNCIIQEFSQNSPETVWLNFSSLINGCILKYSSLSETDFLTFKTAQFDGERKFFLPFVEKVPDPCVWLTIGVGGDTAAEKAFRLKYPWCKLFGIEASRESEGDFASIGTVVPMAVGVERAENLKLILRDKNDGYAHKEVPVTPLHKILDNFVGTRHAHFLSIDVEGFEYEIVSGFRFQRAFYREGVSIYQIDGEFHIPRLWAAGSDFSFQQYFLRLVKESNLLPIHVDKKFGDHKKVVLIDTESTECEQAFGFSRYFLSREKLRDLAPRLSSAAAVDPVPARIFSSVSIIVCFVFASYWLL